MNLESRFMVKNKLKNDENTLEILIPEKLKKYEDDILEKSHNLHIRDKFLYEDVMNNTDLYHLNYDNDKYTEKPYYLSDTNDLFTFSSSIKLKENNVFLILTDKNLGTNAFLPTLTNMSIPYTKEINETIDKFFTENNLENIKYNLSPIKTELQDEVQFYRLNIRFAVTTTIISLCFLAMSLYLFARVYFENKKQEIAIRKFLGFGFWKSHKKIILTTVISYVTIFASFLLIESYAETKIRGLNIFTESIFISGTVLTLSFIVLIILLRYFEKMKIAEVLKGE